MSTWTSERARVASLTRSRKSDDPDLITARRNLRAARIRDWVEDELSKTPPLTADQCADLARLFEGGEK